MERKCAADAELYSEIRVKINNNLKKSKLHLLMLIRWYGEYEY